MLAEPLRVLARVVELLDGLAIAYVIGGSVASGVHGEPRMTQDVDILIELPPSKVDALVQALHGEFYVDPDTVRSAARDRGSFNVIHLAMHHKVDFFVASDEPLDREQLARRMAVPIDPDDTRIIFVTAAENMILRKLDWFRMGNEVSEVQWRDILGMLKISGSLLDLDYIRDLAQRTGLEPLLDRALAQGGL